MKRFLLATLVMAIPVTLAFALTASAAPSRAAGQLPSCYPNHEFTVFESFGAFIATSTGSLSGGGGNATWNMKATVMGNQDQDMGSLFQATPGSIAGSVTATLHVPGVAHTVNFIARCIEEAAAGTPFSMPPPPAPTLNPIAVQVFARFEGHVDTPPWSKGDDTAVLTIAVSSCTNSGVSPQGQNPCQSSVVNPSVPAGRRFAQVTLQHGSTCMVIKGDHYRSILRSKHPSMGIAVEFLNEGDSFFRDRAGLPAGVTPGPGQVCPGIDFGGIF